MENNIIEYSETIFEDIKHIDEHGNEYWLARELQNVLEYKRWDKFCNVINDAQKACGNSNYKASDHFSQVGKMVDIGSKTSRSILDYKLSRYACYLIVQNSDPRKEVVALGQTYFAVQTRRQELTEKEYSLLSEDVNQVAKKAGVKNFDQFHNAGYKGLYNGETADDIAKRKGLRYREDILDNMGSDELIANLFRISQTEQKLKRDNIEGETKARETHYEVGKEVRNTIKRLGGTMLHKIKSVHILSKYILTIEFAEGVTKTYDMTKLIQENSLFKELKDEKLFYDVKVDVGGCGIIWNDAIDVSCDELFANGKEG